MFLRKFKLETSCGISAAKKIIKIIQNTKKYNCNEICEMKCNFDNKLNNLLNSPTDGFFVIEFFGTLLLNLSNMSINNHIMIIEKNKNEYTIHQSFVLVYTKTRMKINKQQMEEIINKLKYINDKSYFANSNYCHDTLVQTINSLFWINCVGVQENKGIEIKYIRSCHTPYLHQMTFCTPYLQPNPMPNYQIISKTYFLKNISIHLKNMQNTY